MLALAVAVAALVLYAPVRNHGFVDYDDFDYVAANPHVRGGLSLAGIRWAFTTGHASNWHPLTWLSHMLDVQLFGLAPGAHLLVSACLHAASAALLLLVLARMTGAVGRSAFVAAMFALHPAHVESVAWLSERKDVLSGLFFVLTLAAYARYVERPGPRHYAAALLAFALGLMAKPMLVTVPFVLLLLDAWPLRRFERGTVRKLVLEKLPFVALSAASCAVTLVVQKAAVVPVAKFPLDRRLANATVSYARYLFEAVWPAKLAVFYPPVEWPAGRVIASALLLAVISVAVVRARTARPYLATGWLWYLGMLVPVVGIVQVGTQAMADRYTYLPYVGLSIVAAWGLTDLLSGRAAVLRALAVGACAAAAWLAFAQVAVWKSTATLFGHALAVTEDNFIAHKNLGRDDLRNGRTDAAVAHYREALRILPTAEAMSALGAALATQGKLDEAFALFRDAVRLDPADALARANFGEALARMRRVDEAEAEFREALRLAPESAQVRNSYGAALAAQNRLTEAEAQYEAALRIDPESADAHNNLGVTLFHLGRKEEAERHYRAAVRLRPRWADAHYNLGTALLDAQQPAGAAAEFTEALRLYPGHEPARQALRLAQSRPGGR